MTEAQDVDSDTPHIDQQEADGGGTELQEIGSSRVLRPNQDDASELSSIDASLVDSLPRRAGSPVDSVTSGRGESIQVCTASADYEAREPG